MREPWLITWAYSGRWALERLHWRDAAMVDAAVQRYAATGTGAVERVPGASTGLLLRVDGYLVRVSLDLRARTIVVWWVMQARR